MGVNLLFSQKTSYFPSIRKNLASLLVILFVGILPILSFWGFWNDYLAFAVYTGKETQAHLEFHSSVPASLQKYQSKKQVIELSNWTIQEMNIAPYPEPKVFQKLAQQLAKSEQTNFTLVIEFPPHWLTGIRRTQSIIYNEN